MGVPDPLAVAGEAAAHGDDLRAPMPGLVKHLDAAAGQAVARGERAGGARGDEDGACAAGAARRGDRGGHGGGGGAGDRRDGAPARWSRLMNDRVTIYEMSPRDGLQNETRPIPTPRKIALVDLLSGCGFTPYRGGEFRQPEVGAADGGRGGGAGRDRARAGGDLWRAGAQPQGLCGGAGGGGGRGGDLRLGLGDVQPAQHQLLDRREPGAIRAGGRGGGGGRDAAARICLLRDRLPLRGRNCTAKRRTGDRPAFRPRMPRGQPRRHHRARHT